MRIYEPPRFFEAFLRGRLRVALTLREQLFSEPFYRLAYGDSDGLPGLIVDRYGEYVVVQIATAGMEVLLEALVAVLVELLAPAGILLRNDASIRDMEQLPMYARVVHGEVPELIELGENGVRFWVSPHGGQKTGWFFDHRTGRRRVAELARGRRVLDVFCYAGAWGVQAAVAGASPEERAGMGKFDANGTIPCAQAKGQPMGWCAFGVARGGACPFQDLARAHGTHPMRPRSVPRFRASPRTATGVGAPPGGVGRLGPFCECCSTIGVVRWPRRRARKMPQGLATRASQPRGGPPRPARRSPARAPRRTSSPPGVRGSSRPS